LFYTVPCHLSGLLEYKVAPLAGVTFIALDVASDASVTTAVDHVIERFGRIDVLVNNAGFGSAGAAEERAPPHRTSASSTSTSSASSG
jgi:NAD(P)-dependent dehydrogenase (short-subunit alcohol dehydrogenase family)